MLVALWILAGMCCAQTTLVVTCPNPLPVATVGQAYTLVCTVTGGTPPYSWSVVAGSLAGTGLSLMTRNNGATVIISGVPTMPIAFPPGGLNVLIAKRRKDP